MVAVRDNDFWEEYVAAEAVHDNETACKKLVDEWGKAGTAKDADVRDLLHELNSVRAAANPSWVVGAISGVSKPKKDDVEGARKAAATMRVRLALGLLELGRITGTNMMARDS